MAIKHSFISPKSDDGIVPGEVKPSDWNDEHTVDGLVGALLSLGVSANVVPYLDGGGNGATFSISTFVAGILASADAATLLQAIGAAALVSPALSGLPTAPTPPGGDNSAKIATTAFVTAAIATLIGTAPAALDTLNELAAALGDDANYAATVTGLLALKAPLNSPSLTGSPTAPTAAGGDSSTKLATTAFVAAAITALALGTAATKNVGTSANQVVQLDGSGKLPAVDGSALTNVVATSFSLTSVAASLTGNVSLSSANTYYDGPSVAQGTSGKWLVTASVTLTNTGGPAEIAWKLWDGATVIDSGTSPIYTTGARITITGAGIINAPAGSLRMTCKDLGTSTSVMEFNRSGNSKDCTITAVQIG